MSAKILQQIDYQKQHYLLEAPYSNIRGSHTKFGVAHDYVWFNDAVTIDSIVPCTRTDHYSSGNFLSIDNATMQIGIKAFKDVILPFLNANEYLQDAHFNKNGKDNYCYTTEILYYNENGQQMVQFKEAQSTVWNKVTLDFYKKYIEPQLQK